MRMPSLVTVAVLASLGSGAPAMAQQDLARGIQDLAKQMTASMTQEQKGKPAILDFTRLDKGTDNFGRYLAEALITSIFDTKRFKVIERSQLDKILERLKLKPSDLIEPQNAKRLRKIHGVDAIVLGSASELAASVEVNGRLIETETGRVFAVARTSFAKDKDIVILIGGSPAGAAPGSGAALPASPGEPVARMVLIPAGQLTYGPEGEEQRISLPAFSMDAYEVTNAEYANVRPHGYPADKANHPVANVSWYDAKRYREAVGKRLPTEQEWEKAARGTDGRHYPWGDTWDSQRANSDSRFGGPTSVGQFPAGKSPYGLFDMAGNVWEWTASDQGGDKVLRGGSWHDLPNYRSSDSGFRCARGVP